MNEEKMHEDKFARGDKIARRQFSIKGARE